MKKLFDKLRELSPGKFFLEIDQHKLYEQSAESFIVEITPKELRDITDQSKEEMVIHDSIIRVEVHPKDLPVSIVVYSFDLKDALEAAIAQYKVAEQEAKDNG